MRYQVQSGDTLFKIAFQHGVDYRQLGLQNGLEEPYLIFPGQVISVVGATSAKVVTAAGPSPSGKVIERALPKLVLPETKAVSISPVASASQPPMTAQPSTDDPEQSPSLWIWPVQGPIVTDFDESVGAKGLDIGGVQDTPIKAAAKGRVVYAGSGLRGYGKLVIIKHSSAMLSAYGHQSRLIVVEGQLVAAGQVIGAMGDTDADRVKLHFEIREFGKPVDPRQYLPEQG